MLISKTAKVRWNSKNKMRYINLGYIFTGMKNEFEAKIEDLTKGSNAIITYECDYCKKLYETTWYLYNYKKTKTIINKDCCDNCLQIKAKESLTEKYGVPNCRASEEVNQKIAKTNLERYGSINPFGSKIIQDKIKKYYVENFGVEHNMQIPEYVQKAKQTSLERYGVENYGALWSKEHSGNKSPTWKEDNIIHERTERNLPEYRAWRKAVYKRDLYTCQCCGEKSGCGHEVILEAHHIFNWNDNPNKRFELNNGITLCQKCHTKFHSIYGRKNNTKKQLKSFLKKYR